MLISAFPDAWGDRRMPPDFEHYMKVKRQADVHLAATDLDWVIVHPGTLTTSPGTDRVRPGPAIPYGDVARDDVAAVFAELVHQPQVNRTILELTGGATPVREAVAHAVCPGAAVPSQNQCARRRSQRTTRLTRPRSPLWEQRKRSGLPVPCGVARQRDPSESALVACRVQGAALDLQLPLDTGLLRQSAGSALSSLPGPPCACAAVPRDRPAPPFAALRALRRPERRADASTAGGCAVHLLHIALTCGQKKPREDQGKARGDKTLPAMDDSCGARLFA
ncbi:NAD(P)H-binding protein [Streptomyces sp. NPDC050759]|uniref:NAD(P)H-binding protein n=1 Tax=Streptomyces sp. NPDC050759 TaxID=3365635 RepID=UPI0037974BE5